MSTSIITMYPSNFRVIPYGDARAEIKNNYEKRAGTDGEDFYLVAAFISCMVDSNQYVEYASLSDEERSEVAKDWFIMSKSVYKTLGEEPDIVY